MVIAMDYKLMKRINRNNSYAKYFISPQQLLKIFLIVDLILKDIISTYNIKKFERHVQKSS